MYDLAELEAALAGTIFAGKLHFTPLTGSTNTDALDATRAGAPHGSVYFADEQLAGRGRGDHAWHSAAGEGLSVSVLLRPHLPAARLPLLAKSHRYSTERDNDCDCCRRGRGRGHRRPRRAGREPAGLARRSRVP